MGERRHESGSGAMVAAAAVILTIVLLLCLVGGGSVVWLMWQRAERAEMMAIEARQQAEVQRRSAEMMAVEGRKLLRDATAVAPSNKPVPADAALPPGTRVLARVDDLWFNAHVVLARKGEPAVVLFVDWTGGDHRRTVARDQLQWP